MLKFSLTLAVCVLMTVGGSLLVLLANAKTPKKCPFNLKSDLVTAEDVKQNVEGEEWLLIYYTEFSTQQSFGKCIYKLNAPAADKTIQRQLMCYNTLNGDCEDFERIITSTVDECGRVEENGVNTGFNAKYYSQNINEYFWYPECYEFSGYGECTERYLSLLVRGSRYMENGALDLQGLPFHYIVADLKKNFNLDMSDDVMKFSWKGPECGFDGNIKQ